MTPNPVAALVLGLLASAGTASAADWTTGCDAAADHCTAQGLLLTPGGERTGTIGLQVGRDGTGAVVFVTTPLGAALQPGVKLRAPGRDFDLAFDVCYPDGCRARLSLAPADLAALLGLDEADLLLFSFGSAEPAILVTPLGGLREALSGKVRLPD
jgi:invasion protein IalB